MTEQYVLEALPTSAPGLTETECLAAMKVKAREANRRPSSRRTVQRAIQKLVADGMVQPVQSEGRAGGNHPGARYYATSYPN